jgi:DNA polymerase-3 subunit alpha
MAGAFDSLIPIGKESNEWRAQLFAATEDALSLSQRSWNDRERGQVDLFGSATSGNDVGRGELPEVRPWTQSEMSQKEKSSIGFYLSVHPLDSHTETLSGLGVLPIAERTDIKAGDRLKMAGVVSALAVRYSKKALNVLSVPKHMENLHRCVAMTHC